MMRLASTTATNCPYCQTYHTEVAKMFGATDRVKRISCGSISKRLLSNVLHVQNYDYIPL